MIALAFSEFYKGDFEDIGYELYFLKDADSKAMYIGISRNSVWHRWFDGLASHMRVGAQGKLRGQSYIGEVIERRFPSSLDWTIELWTKEDCLEIFSEEFMEKNLESINIQTIEPYLIKKFEPIYNVMHGGGHHEDPMITKKLDDAFRKLFG